MNSLNALKAVRISSLANALLLLLNSWKDRLVINHHLAASVSSVITKSSADINNIYTICSFEKLEFRNNVKISVQYTHNPWIE